jgi:hypothetical protein
MGATSGYVYQGISGIGEGYVKADAYRAQADYENKIAELNNKSLDYQISQNEDQAADAISRGEKAALRRDQKTRLLQGAQRAAMAAGGGSIDSEALGYTETIGEADKVAIKANSWREAFGYTSKANQLRGEQNQNNFDARTKANALNYAARSSIITGYSSAAGSGFKAAGEYKTKDKGKKS